MTPTAPTHAAPSFAETTVMELVTATTSRASADPLAPRAAGRAASAPAARTLPASATSLLTLAVASLVVVPLSTMAMVLARLGGLG